MLDDPTLLHYSENTTLYWTGDQVNPEIPRAFERLDPADDADEASTPSGTDMLDGSLVYPTDLAHLTGVSGHANAQDMAPLLAEIRRRPKGLAIAISDEHASRRYCWGLFVYDSREMLRTRFSEPPEPLFVCGPDGLREIAQSLTTYVSGYRASLVRALRAEFRVAPPEDYPTLFQEAVSADEAWALSIVEHGLRGPSDDEALLIAPHLKPADLDPLLAAQNREIRERTIRTLARLRGRRMR